jgi:hypothetical protein
MKNIIDPKEIHLISEGMLLSILALNENENDSMSVSLPILTLIDIFKRYEAEETRKVNHWCKREDSLELELSHLRELIPSESKDNGKKMTSFMQFKEMKLAERNAKKLNND